jgi:hypothetical protein
MADTTRTRWSPSLAPPKVWLVGPWHDREFAIVRQALGLLISFQTLETLAAASAELGKCAGESPEVLLLAQERPGCWSQAEIDHFQVAAPLVRVVIVAGVWCEGERRTGRPLVGAARLYWHEVPAWWRQAVARRDAGLAPNWSAVGGIVETNQANSTAVESPGGTLAIDSRDYATYEALAAAFRSTGWECLWTPRGQGNVSGAVAGIWDGGQLEPEELEALQVFCQRFGNGSAPVIALVDFPRPEHVALAHEAGAAVLLGKPYSLAALANEVERVVAGSSGAAKLKRMPTA